MQLLSFPFAFQSLLFVSTYLPEIRKGIQPITFGPPLLKTIVVLRAVPGTLGVLLSRTNI